jgi:hypothetical protein
MNTIKDFAVGMTLSVALAGAAYATLPPAPEAAKEQAKEAAAKSAWQDKVAAYKLCLTQDQVADRYRKDLKGEGKTAPAPMTAAACQDPGPFVSPMAQKPLEASGAHSPSGTAATPPSQNATAAETMGSKKPQ